MKSTLCAAAVFVLALSAAAGADAAFRVLPGQRILLNGDSIAKGYAFGNYTDLSPLRTIYGIANILLRENLSHPPAFQRVDNVWEGLNPDGTPKTVDTLAGEIQANIRRGEIRTGDWMVYEDAGQLDITVHPAPSPIRGNLYWEYRKNIRGMVEEADRTIGRRHFLFMTMFDYHPRCKWCQWDVPLDDGLHTGNDAIRDEAAALHVRVIQMKRIMDHANDYLQKAGWGRVVGPDGIHPNVYGNAVMTFAILGALGADIGHWGVNTLAQHFRHPETGGDVPTVWGFVKDPSDAERLSILRDLKSIVAGEMPNGVITPPVQPAAGFLRHGRLLDHPARQPGGASLPVSYEIGKLFQLDENHVLLAASMREQGGHDFEVGNDGFVFSDLSEIVPERAAPINRLDPGFHLADGRPAVLAKFPVNGGFLPRGARDEKGIEYPGGGTGFLAGAAVAYTPDRQDSYPNMEPFVTLQQARWDGKQFTVRDDFLPESMRSKLTNVGFNCLFEKGSFLCPFVSRDGILVVRFDFEGGHWRLAASGKPFHQAPREVEPSLRKTGMGYLVYTRGADRKGRVYRSIDGLNYYFVFDHWNWTVPQSLNQGLDGSLYLTTNTGPGYLRNPLLAFSFRGQSFVDPVIVHDEKQIGDNQGPEVPFVDHAIAENVLLNGTWRHLLLYRVCELRETNGQGAPPRPQTGLYLAEREYGTVSEIPFRFH